MRLIYVLTEVEGDEYPFNVIAMPDDNWGENFSEEVCLWLWSFTHEENAQNFIRDMQNAPILRQTISKEGKITRDGYIQNQSSSKNTSPPQSKKSNDLTDFLDKFKD